MKKKDVVIIGAGPAGLSTAYNLLKISDEYNVIILESEKIIGGISKTIEFDGYKIDTGIHRFFTKNDEVNNLWNEVLKMQSKPAYDDIILNRKKEYDKSGVDPEKCDKCWLIKDRYTRIYYGEKFYDYPVKLNLKTISNMGFLTFIKAGFSYLKAVIFKKKETSLENFYINRFGKVLYSMFFESYTEKVWGVHPRNISADWGKQRVKGLSIIKILKECFKKVLHIKNNSNTETSLIDSFIYPKLGSGQIYEEMANEIIKMGGNIIYEAKVKEINVDKKGNINKIVYLKNNKKENIKCDICVSSMPIKNLFESLKNINIPKKVYNSATKLPYREFMSVGLVVDKFNMKNDSNIKTINNIIPDSWIYMQEPNVKMGRIQVFNNWSPYMFKKKEEINNKIMFSLEYFCSEGDKYWNMSDDDFIDFAISEAEKLNIIKRENVENKVRIKINKAYPAYFGTYKNIEKIKDFINNDINNLYCIGRNGQHRYNNMDHSILTGIRASEAILNKITKEEVWNVNVEQEYHEEKK